MRERTPEEILAFLTAIAVVPQYRGHILDLLCEEYPGIARVWQVDRLVEEYHNHTPKISLLPGIASLLSDLRADGAHLAVITDGVSHSQHRKVKALRLAELVDMIVVTDDKGLEYRKPHPYAFQSVSQRFGHQSSGYVYIGDNPLKDFIAPRRLGWETVRLRMRNQLHEAAEPLAAEAAPRVECRSVAALRIFLTSRLPASDTLEARQLIV